MTEKKGKYLIWLESLHRQYTDRTCITQMGRQAAAFQLLAEMYEIRCRFGKILERMEKEAFQLDDEGLNYEEWISPEKWKRGESLSVEEDMRETFGIKPESPLAQTYANRLGDAYKEDAKFNTDQFRNMVSSLFIFDQIVNPSITDVAIERELKSIQALLLDIHNAKRRTLSDQEYADYYDGLYDSYINGFLVKSKLISEHKKWRDNLDGECDKDDMLERQAELLLEIFESGFADDLKQSHRIKEDVFGFRNYEFEKWKGRTDEAVKYFSAFVRICPYENGMIDFSHNERLGKHIINHHVEPSVVNTFFQKMELIKMVQEDICRFETPKTTNVSDEAKTDPKADLNYFQPTRHLKDLLKQDWFKQLRSNEKYDETWTDTFVEALMASEWKDDIARDWAVKGRREKKNQIKGYVIGLLVKEGVLKGTYDKVAEQVGLMDNSRTFSRYMSEGGNQPYAEWVNSYLSNK